LLVVLIGTVVLLCSCDCNHENLSQATCTTASTCFECGETISAALGHTDGEWFSDKEANCTEDGSKHQVCSVCNDTIKTETLTKLGHTEGEWITDKEPNCTEDGSQHQVCSVCNDTIKNYTIPAVGHVESDFVIDVSATIHVEGLQHTYCTICNKEVQTNIVVPRITSNGLAYEVNEDGTTCTITPSKSGDTTFTAVVCDAKGNAVSADEQAMTSKAGFFDKIIAFFKKLFGMTKVIPQAFKGIY
jgi:hypothetical protein